MKNTAYDKNFFAHFVEEKHSIKHNGYGSYKNAGKRKYKIKIPVKTLSKRIIREQQIEPKQELHRKA
jgi:hypothetical protein